MNRASHRTSTSVGVLEARAAGHVSLRLAGAENLRQIDVSAVLAREPDREGLREALEGRLVAERPDFDGCSFRINDPVGMDALPLV